MLDETRKRGYAIRNPVHDGDFDKPSSEHDDGTTAIAVPITLAGRIVATINLHWSRRVGTTEQIARHYLKDLNAAAELIAQRLADGAAK